MEGTVKLRTEEAESIGTLVAEDEEGTIAEFDAASSLMGSAVDSFSVNGTEEAKSVAGELSVFVTVLLLEYKAVRRSRRLLFRAAASADF